MKRRLDEHRQHLRLHQHRYRIQLGWARHELLGVEVPQDICLEAQSGTLFYYRKNKRINPDQIKESLAAAYEVFGMMVDHQ